MSRPSKWFVVRDTKLPAIEIARRCLRERLRHVWRMLCAATFHDIDQLEAVHQLRVATRRASTAIDLFEPLQELLPATAVGEDRFWLAKQLKKLRRAAGEARDADVLRQYYERVPVKEQPPKKLRRLLAERSGTARKPVRKLLTKFRNKNFPARVQALLREMQSPEQAEPTFCEFARQTVVQLWQKYAATAQANLHDIDKLHEFRIETKEFRYALELFVSVLPQELSETLYSRVSELQESLGTINDHAVAIDYWSQQQAALTGKKTQAWLDRELPQRAAALQQAHEKFLVSWPHQWAALGRDWAALGLSPCQELAAAETPTSAESEAQPLTGSELYESPVPATAPLTTLSWPETATPLPWQTS